MSSTVGPSEAPVYAAGPAGGPPQLAARNGLGTAALVLGIIALVTCWTVIGGVVLGLLAIVLGAVGRGRAKRGEASNGGVAVAGILTGLLGLVLAVVLVVAGTTFFAHHKTELQKLNSCLKNATSQSQQNSCNKEFKSSVTGNN